MDPIVKILGEWAGQLNPASITLRTILVLILSASIGWERSIKRHSAGLRTFMLVSLAAEMIIIVELNLPNNSTYFLSAAAILAIAYISSGALFTSSRNQIRGLTTSVGLWASGIIGIAIGSGQYTVGIVTYLGLLLCLFFFPKLEKSLKDRSNHFEVHLELIDSKYLQNFVSTIRELGLEIDDIEFNPAYVRSGLSVYSVAISINSQLLKQYKTHEDIINALNTLEYVNHIEEIQ